MRPTDFVDDQSQKESRARPVYGSENPKNINNKRYELGDRERRDYRGMYIPVRSNRSARTPRRHIRTYQLVSQLERPYSVI